MLRTRAREEFNKNRKIIVREVPPVTYDEVKSYMGPFAVSNIAISKRLRHAIVELKHGQEAESAVEFLADKKLLNSEVKASLFRQDNLLCVEGVPDAWGWEDFRGFVAPHGGIEKCFLWVDEEDRSLGYGFVEYVHNKDLSEVARLDLDRRQLHSGHVTRCRFVKDHVTGFDQLQSTCIVVTNLPLEVGVERFYHLLLNFGNGAIKPINYQVGIATGTTMERFGAAEFESPEAAEVMRRRMNGRFHPIKKEEGEEPMSSQNQSKAELKASFCTPGESIDDIMKNMTSLLNSNSQVKQLGTSLQGVYNQSQVKLVHPAIQSMLKSDQRALSDFQSVLEHMGSSNKDISDHTNNIHFQTAVLSLMMSSTKNNSIPYNPQKLCSLTATILKSMSNNNVSNKTKLKKAHQSRSQRSSTDRDPISASQHSAIGRCSSTNCPLDPSTEDTTCNDEVLSKHSVHLEAPKNVFPLNSPSVEAAQPPALISSTTEITSPWKLLPSFARSRPIPSIETFEQKSDEPYPGFDTDLAYVVRFLQTKEVPSSLTNEGASRTSSTGEVPALCFSSEESVGRPTPPVRPTDRNFPGFSKNVRPRFASLQHPPDTKFQFADRNSWNRSSRLGFPDLQQCRTECRRDLMFFDARAPAKMSSLDLQQNSAEFPMTCNRKKKWRPKVVEQCWNNLVQKNSENSTTTSFHFDASLLATKKRRALSENQSNNVVDGGTLFLDSDKCLVQSSFPQLTSASLRPPLSGLVKNLEVPVEIPPPGEDSSHEVAYVGQHQQGLGGLYADSLLRKRKFREVLDARCKSFF